MKNGDFKYVIITVSVYVILCYLLTSVPKLFCSSSLSLVTKKSTEFYALGTLFRLIDVAIRVKKIKIPSC